MYLVIIEFRLTASKEDTRRTPQREVEKKTRTAIPFHHFYKAFACRKDIVGVLLRIRSAQLNLDHRTLPRQIPDARWGQEHLGQRYRQVNFSYGSRKYQK